MANKKRGGYGIGINLTGPGTIFTLGFIALAVGMGLLLSRGVTPKSTLSDPGQGQEYELISETPDPAQKGLQLKTLKFKECANTVTIDLLLDRSGSMNDPTPSGQTKLSRLQEAVSALVKDAKDTSIIGFQSFSSDTQGIVPILANDVPISYYKDVKSIFQAKLNALNANGGTPTHDALEFSYNILKDSIPNFPKDRKFNFIFISDGEPNPVSQDPRLFNPNPADQIKQLGVNVYSLGIFDGNQNNNPILAGLLKSVASTPDQYYAANTGDDVKRLLTQISQKICDQEPTPTP
jgi:uncharacterized protein YegL